MPDPQIIIAIIAGLASIAVAAIQAISARKDAVQQQVLGAPTLVSPKKKIPLLILLIFLDLAAVAAAVSWIIVAAIAPGQEVGEYQKMLNEAKAAKNLYSGFDSRSRSARRHNLQKCCGKTFS